MAGQRISDMKWKSFVPTHLWRHRESCAAATAAGAASRGAERGTASLKGGCTSLATEASSGSVSESLVDSFDQDAPVFSDPDQVHSGGAEAKDTRGGGSRGSRGGAGDRGVGANSNSKDPRPNRFETEKPMTHQKLKEQWSTGSAAERSEPSGSSMLGHRRALSASCPTLDSTGALLSVAPSSAANDDARQLAVDNEEDEGMLHKSMLNLSDTDRGAPASCQRLGLQPSADGVAMVTSDALRVSLTSALPEVSVQICINDVSVDNAEDFAVASGDEDDLNLETIRRQKRRSSWCPEQERKKDEKEEKLRMLGINGRSQSLSSLEGQDDSDDDSDDDDDDDDDDDAGSLATRANAPSKLFAQHCDVDSASGNHRSSLAIATGHESKKKKVPTATLR